jgi:ATP/maltotriose-dependent transcriptional regulator MalT/DNA-binding SARP family transcriptional activator
MPTMPSRPAAGVAAPRRKSTNTEPPSGSPVAPEDAAPDEAAPSSAEGPSGARRSAEARTARRPRIRVEGATASGARAVPAAGQVPAPSDYPVQLGKVQAPLLRDDTLARDRLLDWLSIKIHSRAVLLVAEAGYGKTTLLADFSRRTRVRVLWFRLDRGDRDWVGFIAHLVAALRIHQPAFGASTSALLREMATSAPSIDAVLDTFLRELSALPDDPTAFVFDDVHLVDDAADVRDVFRELLARAPDRMSFVFASRREPPIRLARLRALGEVAELGADDLRFDAVETERLFRETYQMPLEPSVLAELGRRTEGWAASLQLVRAAIHDRNPAQVRTFIASLSGAEGHLYEYLAEEVIGELPEELQQFLMRTSVLETVDLTLGPVAAGITEAATRNFIEEGVRHGLFGRGGGPGSRPVSRAHPLVREFLHARLKRSIGAAGVRRIHLEVANAAEPLSWESSARHFMAGGREGEARRVLSSALETILATGALVAAEELSESLGSAALTGVQGLVLRSRLAQRRSDVREGLNLAEEAWAKDRDSAAALLNLFAARTLAGDVAAAMDAGRRLEQSGHSDLADMARVALAVMEASVSGSVVGAIQGLQRLNDLLRSKSADRYLAVSLLNIALLDVASSEFQAGLSSANEAIALLSSTSAGMELVSARLARACLLAYLGDIRAARSEIELAMSSTSSGQELELVAEIGQMEGLLGESSAAWPLFARVKGQFDPTTDHGEQAIYARALLRIQDGDVTGARRDVDLFQHDAPRSTMAFEARRLLLEGLVHFLEGNDGRMMIEAGTSLAQAQGARLWSAYGETLAALLAPNRNASSAVEHIGHQLPVVLTMLAEPVLARLHELNRPASALVYAEAERRPWRWRPGARRGLEKEAPVLIEAAAKLLAKIGETSDIPRLGEIERRIRDRRGSRLASSLARRLADPIFVEDLGRVRILVGDRSIEGSEIRRRVLALLCLLLTQPDFSATREHVIDSLWPENDPDSALNSLNQTVYFLRRVFEPRFAEEISPGYVGQDGETIWLDEQLVDCRSRRCLALIRSMPGEPTPEGSVALATQYRGRFALDFAYEEWSASYRDGIHASYLRVMEHAIGLDLDNGHLGRGTFLAERAAEIDPDAEEIQVALVRLYRHSGAHAAASEQYAHYARAVEEMGLEPTAFADL